MRNFFITLILILVLGNNLEAQNNADSLALLIYIEDAIGQKDSVFVYIKQGASNGFNPELGEVNLYNIPPQSDLDLRLVQRTDTNMLMDTLCLQGPFWLIGSYSTSYAPYPGGGIGTEVELYGWVRPFKENADMKIKYISASNGTEYFGMGGDGCRPFAFKINAKKSSYPIKVFFQTKANPDFIFEVGRESVTSHDANTGELIGVGYGGVGKMFLIQKIEDIGYYDPYYPFMFELPLYDVDNNQYSIRRWDLEPSDIIFCIHYCPITFIRENDNAKILYPNPANNYVVLASDDYNSEYLIINNDGIVIKNAIVDNVDCIIDISFLPASTYYIKTKNNFYKLMKETK